MPQTMKISSHFLFKGPKLLLRGGEAQELQPITCLEMIWLSTLGKNLNTSEWLKQRPLGKLMSIKVWVINYNRRMIFQRIKFNKLIIVTLQLQILHKIDFMEQQNSTIDFFLILTIKMQSPLSQITTWFHFLLIIMPILIELSTTID